MKADGDGTAQSKAFALCFNMESALPYIDYKKAISALRLDQDLPKTITT